MRVVVPAPHGAPTHAKATKKKVDTYATASATKASGYLWGLIGITGAAFMLLSKAKGG